MNTDPGTPDEEDDERTVVVGRGSGLQHAVPALSEDDEETILREDRFAAPSVDDGADDEETIVRPTRRNQALDAPADDANDANDANDADDANDRTVVVDRHAPDAEDRTVIVDRPAPDLEDRTIVVDRPAPDTEDRTVVVDRPAASEDRTVVVDRGTSTGGAPASGTSVSKAKSVSRQKTPLRRARRKAITLPPGEPISDRVAVPSLRPNAVEPYAPRALPEPPPAVPVVELGPEASRLEAPSMPSVDRRSRSIGRTAVIAAAVACVVSVAGLITIAVTVFTGP